MQVDERSFRKALGCFATGVTVVTAVDAARQPIGVTVNAFTSVSLDPPLVLFCLDKKTKSLNAFKGGQFAINILRDDQRDVSVRFATRGDDKWQGVEVDTSANGVPLIRNCLARLECSLHELIEGGDHLIIVGLVEDLTFQASGEPLVYFRGGYARLEEDL